jgi:hypothetical protein
LAWVDSSEAAPDLLDGTVAAAVQLSLYNIPNIFVYRGK